MRAANGAPIPSGSASRTLRTRDPRVNYVQRSTPLVVYAPPNLPKRTRTDESGDQWIQRGALSWVGTQ